VQQALKDQQDQRVTLARLVLKDRKDQKVIQVQQD
jgi:hypothetical protein